MSTYKLYYFNTRGSVETSRIILAQAGVKYEDIRFEAEQWAKEYKESKLVNTLYIERFESAYIFLKLPHLDVLLFWKLMAQR